MSETEPQVPVEELASWLRTYQGRYTNEALRNQLLRHGYAPETIDRAFELAATMPPAAAGQGWHASSQGMPGEPTRQGSLGDSRTGWLVGILAIVLLPGVGLVGTLAGIPVAIVAGRTDFAKGLAYAVLTFVVVIVVAIVGLFGLCLVTGAPTPS